MTAAPRRGMSARDVFQALSYIVDIYRRNAEPTNRFVDFAAYIALFPQLIAGPILHAPIQVVQMAVLMAMMPTGAGPFMLAQVYGVSARVERCSQGRNTVLIDAEI